MQPASLALKRLDTATRSLHAAADDRWIELLRPDVSLLAYAAQLERSYGFIAPYDVALAYRSGLALRPRMRTTPLVRDLFSLGRTPHQIATLPMCLEIEVASAGAALGWIYVVERSALVHAGLLRHLRYRLPIANASAFLEADERSCGSVWEDLGHALDGTHSLDDVIGGAQVAFATQRAWFERGGGAAERHYG